MNKQEHHDSACMVDSVTVVHKDKNGKVLSTKTGFPDAFTKYGMAAVAQLIIATGGSYFTAVAIGTGATGATVNDSTLETEIKRKAATTLTLIKTVYTNDTSEWMVEFSSSDGLSGTQTVTEIGILDNNSAGGILLLHQVFSPGDVCNWDQGDKEDVIVKFQMKQGS